MRRHSTAALDPSPSSFLPLKPTVLLILTALAQQPRHGYAIAATVREQSEGNIELGTSHLYRHLKKLLDDGLAIESETRPEADDDARRRYYVLTELGRRVLGAEMRRLELLVRLGHDLGLISRIEPI